MSLPSRGIRHDRIRPASWVGAVAVHVVIAGLLLQFGTEPARSKIPSRPDVEAVRVQAADERLLRQRREAHRRALREEELRERREREAEREARRQAEEKKKQAAARAKAERKAEEEAKRKREEKHKAEREARRKAEARAEAERERAEAARRLKEAEDRARSRREEQARRRQREADRRARQADVWRIAIMKKIEQRWLQPPATRLTPCEVVVEQDEKGAVLSAKVQDCRASKTWQDSLRNAVLKASPLPPPPDPALFDRVLVITFYPKDAR